MNNMHWLEILVTVLIAVLLLLVEHYWPWRGLLKRDSHLVANYAMGTLAMWLPLSGLFLMWGLWLVVLAMWLTALLGGLAVLGVYALDGWITTQTRLSIAEGEAAALRPDTLRPGVSDDEGQGKG